MSEHTWTREERRWCMQIVPLVFEAGGLPCSLAILGSRPLHSFWPRAWVGLFMSQASPCALPLFFATLVEYIDELAQMPHRSCIQIERDVTRRFWLDGVLFNPVLALSLTSRVGSIFHVSPLRFTLVSRHNANLFARQNFCTYVSGRTSRTFVAAQPWTITTR